MSALATALKIRDRLRTEGPATPTRATDSARSGSLSGVRPAPCGGSSEPAATGTTPTAPEPPPVTAPAYTPVTTPAGVIALVEAVAGWAKPIALDTETTGLDPARDRVRLLQLAMGLDVAIIDVFAFPDRKAGVRPAVYKRWWTGRSSGTTSSPSTCRSSLGCGFSPSRLFDTAIASRTVYAGELEEDTNAKMGHGLADAVHRELGIAIDKDNQKSDWGRAILSREQLEYAAADVVHLVRLSDALRRKARERNIEATIELEMKCAVPVARMAARGVAFDSEGWNLLAVQAEQRRDELAAEMNALVPNPSCQGKRASGTGTAAPTSRMRLPRSASKSRTLKRKLLPN